MMKIKHKSTNKVLFEIESNSLEKVRLRKADLPWADLSKANLIGADLRGANLSGADLRGADLNGADLRLALGNGKEINTIIAEKTIATWHANTLAIGCIQKSFDDWMLMSDEEISEIGDLILWKNWKPIFKAICDMAS